MYVDESYGIPTSWPFHALINFEHPYEDGFYADFPPNCCVGVGDETRSWSPPMVKTESAYFLSINRNKKVGNVFIN